MLGEQAYESLVLKGEKMSAAAMVTYAYDQLGRARTQLKYSRAGS